VSDAVNLRIPGPTPLPDAVREAGSRQMVNHRGPEFKELLGRVSAGMARGFRTSNEVLMLTSSGTGALEAAVVNFLSAGDSVLSVSIGVFGDRFASIARTYGADVTKIDAVWGQAADPAAVSAALRRLAADGKPAKAVLITHNETSTGVTNPLADLAAAVRSTAPDALILVDGISGLGAVPFETDGWGLDVVAAGSQKSWMVPPGLAFASVSPRAWAANESATMPRFYFDLRKHRDAAAKGETPWTPAVSVAFGLDVALGIIEAEGYEHIFLRHAACAAAARAGLTALGFRLFADPAHASNTVTSAYVPDGVDWSVVSKELRGRGLVLAGGQGTLTGKVFRLGHLGAVSVDDIVRAIETLEAGAAAQGVPVVRGTGAAAAADAAATVLSTGQLAAAGAAA